jgi:hypothetical protein
MKNLEENKRYNIKRTLNMMLFGSVVSGIGVYKTFQFLEYCFGNNGIKSVIKKTLFNQLSFAWIAQVSMYFWIQVFENSSQNFEIIYEKFIKKLKSDFPTTLVDGWKVITFSLKFQIVLAIS